MRASDAQQQWSEVGDFSELTPLGGAGSEVFRARSRDGDRFVALRLWFGSSEEEMDAVRERVVRAARVSHPMLAAVEGCEERGSGALWIIAEYVPGPSLAAWYNGGRLLPLAAAIDLVRRLSQGLAVALENGVSHHALTPKNIIVRRQDPRGGGLRLEAKLLDLERATWMRPGMPGLPAAHFMAPEALALALAGADPDPCLDARANVYALGALLYYLATGVYAFDSADYSQLTAALAGGAPIAPRRLNPRITDGLERVLLDALCISPGGRPSDPAAFGSALEQCAARARSAWVQGAETLPESMESALAFAQSGGPPPVLGRAPASDTSAQDPWDELVRELTNPDLSVSDFAPTGSDASPARKSQRAPARPTLRGPVIDAWPAVATGAKLESVSSSDTYLEDAQDAPVPAEERGEDVYSQSETDEAGETSHAHYGSGHVQDATNQTERDTVFDVRVSFAEPEQRISANSPDDFTQAEQDDESAAAALAETADDELGPPIVYAQPDGDDADPDLVRTYEVSEAELGLHGESSSADADDAEEWDELELIPSAEDDGPELDYAQAHVTRPDASEDDEVDEQARTRTLSWRSEEDTGLSSLRVEKPASWSVHHDEVALQADIDAAAARRDSDFLQARTSEFATISEVDLLEEPVTIPMRARLPVQREPFEWAPSPDSLDALPRPAFPEVASAVPVPVETLSYRGTPHAGRASQPPFPLHEPLGPAAVSPLDAVQRHSAQLRAAQRQAHEQLDAARAEFEAARRGASAHPDAESRLPPPPRRVRAQTPGDFTPYTSRPTDLEARVTPPAARPRVATPAPFGPRTSELDGRAVPASRPRTLPPNEVAPFHARSIDLDSQGAPTSWPRKLPPQEAAPHNARATELDSRAAPASRPRTLPPHEAAPFNAPLDDLDGRFTPEPQPRGHPLGEVVGFAAAELEGRFTPDPYARLEAPSHSAARADRSAAELDGRLTPAPRSRTMPPGEVSPYAMRASDLDGRLTPASKPHNPPPGESSPYAMRASDLDGRFTPASKPRNPPPGESSPYAMRASDLDGRFTPASRARVQTPSHSAPRSAELDGRFTPASQPTAQTPSGRGPASQASVTGAGSRRLQRATLPPGFQAPEASAPVSTSARVTSQQAPFRLEQFSRPPSRARRAWTFTLWLSVAALAAAAISYFVVMRFTRPEPQPTLMSTLTPAPAPLPTEAPVPAPTEPAASPSEPAAAP